MNDTTTGSDKTKRTVIAVALLVAVTALSATAWAGSWFLAAEVDAETSAQAAQADRAACQYYLADVGGADQRLARLLASEAERVALAPEEVDAERLDALADRVINAAINATATGVEGGMTTDAFDLYLPVTEPLEALAEEEFTTLDAARVDAYATAVTALRAHCA